MSWLYTLYTLFRFVGPLIGLSRFLAFPVYYIVYTNGRCTALFITCRVHSFFGKDKVNKDTRLKLCKKLRKFERQSPASDLYTKNFDSYCKLSLQKFLKKISFLKEKNSIFFCEIIYKSITVISNLLLLILRINYFDA